MKNVRGGDERYMREFSLPLPAKEAVLAPWVPAAAVCLCAPGSASKTLPLAYSAVGPLPLLCGSCIPSVNSD